ncbi:WD repeat-containing protein 53 [Fagus crenata]
MDVSRVIESLDSLWFFTNIISSRNNSLESTSSDGITPQKHVNESSKEELSEPISPILQKQLNVLPNAENLFPMCPKCGDFEAKIEPQMVKLAENEALEFQMSAEKQERRKTRRRSKRSLNPRRKIIGELDLGLDVEELSRIWMFKETCGYERFGDEDRNKMPPFNDNVAMKEHLKTWAFAVACTVR